MVIPPKAQQETTLGQGLALGARMSGIDSLNGPKTALEMGFRRAWRAWNFTRFFPDVAAGPANDSIFRILAASSTRSTHHIAEWRGSWPFTPVILVEWSDGEVADVIHEEIPASAWQQLAHEWLKKKSRSE
jgi:hypothetical protein